MPCERSVSWRHKAQCALVRMQSAFRTHESDNQLTETALFASRQCSVRTNAADSTKLENRKCELIELSLSSCGEQVDISLQFSTVLSRTHIRQLSLPSTRPHSDFNFLSLARLTATKRQSPRATQLRFSRVPY